MQTNNYFNTTRSSGAQREQYEHQAKSQEEVIYEYFASRHGMEYSPSQVREYLNLTSAPITSVRRAITNLTNASLLTKTDRQTAGPYGRPEYLWTLKRNDEAQGDLFHA